jgi:hypothetical protein
MQAMRFPLPVLFIILILLPFRLVAEEREADVNAKSEPAASAPSQTAEESGSTAPEATDDQTVGLEIPATNPEQEQAEETDTDVSPRPTASWMGTEQRPGWGPMGSRRCAGAGRCGGYGYHAASKREADTPSPRRGYSAMATPPRGWQMGPSARHQGPWGYGRGMADYGEHSPDDRSRGDIQARAYPQMPSWGAGPQGMPQPMAESAGQGQRQSPLAAGEGNEDARILDVLMRIEARLGRIESLLGKLTW